MDFIFSFKIFRMPKTFAYWFLYQIPYIHQSSREIFTINLKLEHFWVNLLYILEDNIKLVVKLWNKIRSIEECLDKVIFWIIAPDRYSFSDKIISSSISHPFFRTVNGKISSIYFFRGYIWGLSEFLDFIFCCIK